MVFVLTRLFSYEFPLCCVAWFLFGSSDFLKNLGVGFMIGMHDFYYEIRQLFWIF
jgi:hypothetical protein